MGGDSRFHSVDGVWGPGMIMFIINEWNGLGGRFSGVVLSGLYLIDGHSFCQGFVIEQQNKAFVFQIPGTDNSLVTYV
jgi:hypothetical protein